MRLERDTFIAVPTALKPAMTFSTSTHPSEGTTSMARQHTPARTNATLRALAGGGGSPRLTNLRPFATAGVVLVGAGLAVFTPPPPSLGHVPGSSTVRGLVLAADGGLLDDALSPWTQVFNTASENATQLYNAFSLSGNAAWEQLVANLSGYAQQVLDDPANITQVTDELRESWKAVESAITLTNANPDTVTSIIQQTMDGSAIGGHTLMFGEIPGYLPADEAATITPIINFLGSPMSGVVMGMLGPGISPWVALLNSLTDGDSFSQTMVNMTGAFFNGATLDLSSLTPAINSLGLFPAPMAMTHLDIAFGGLLSPGGNVVAAPLSVVDDAGNVAGQVPAIGGSIFNSVGLTFTGVPVLGTLQLNSDPIGPLGALLGLNQVIASQLGWGTGWWNGKSSAPEVPAIPPGSDTAFPTVPGSDFFSDYFPADDAGAGSAAATDLAGVLQDLFTGLGV